MSAKRPFLDHSAMEAIHKDALPSLKQGKQLIDNFYRERSRSRRELAQFFRSPRMRVVEREIAVFMAETRVQHNYLKVSGRREQGRRVEWGKMGHQGYNGSPTFFLKNLRKILAVMMIEEG